MAGKLRYGITKSRSGHSSVWATTTNQETWTSGKIELNTARWIVADLKVGVLTEATASLCRNVDKLRRILAAAQEGA